MNKIENWNYHKKINLSKVTKQKLLQYIQSKKILTSVKQFIFSLHSKSQIKDKIHLENKMLLKIFPSSSGNLSRPITLLTS